MENKMELICLCGEIIPEDNIDMRNRCNDEGEDYCEFEAKCPSCNREFETTEWGELYMCNPLEVMQEFINDQEN